VKNCTEFIELISVYADGELTGPDTFELEAHLRECESCSALLDMYREISISADEQSREAPEALRIGVMNRIRNEDIFHTTGKVKQRSRLNLVLMRYAPIAACLVAVLLLWQFWGDLWNTQDLRNTQNDAMDAAPAPQAAPVPAEPAPDAAYGVFDSFDEAPADDAEQPEAQYDGPAAEGESGPDDQPGGRSLQANTLSPEETERVSEFISGAFAEITVSGELPVMLLDYQPKSFGPWLEWEMVFEIPSTKVPELLSELGNREDFSVTQNPDNQDSAYAIVLYSPG